MSTPYGGPPSDEPRGPHPSDPWESTAPAADRSWITQVLVIGLVLVLLISLGGAAFVIIDQQRDIRRLQSDVGQLQDELAEAEEEIARLRAEQPAVEEGGDGLGGMLDDLLEGFGGGDLDGLLEQFGDLGSLEDLLGGGLGGNSAAFACLASAMETDQPVRPIEGASAREQVAEIAERVQEIRGQRFDGPVEPTFLDRDAFAAEVREIFDEEYTPDLAEADERILKALGAIPADTDLRALYLDLISGQAAGFYDPDTGRIVVAADDPSQPLTDSEQITLAHELEHALSDQQLGLPDTEPDPEADVETDDVDGQLASLSLVEGGATLTMQQFAASALDQMAQLRLGMDPSIAEAQQQLQGYPHYLQRGLVFPYEDGLAFTCSIHADGGWSAVDTAYDDLPTTTAQVLFPERYAAGEGATAPQPLPEAIAGWDTERTMTFGAADLLWLFEAPGDDTDAALSDAREQVAAWGGGALRLWTRGEDSAVGVALVDRDGGQTLCDAVAAWYQAAFPGGRDAGAAEGEELAVDGQTQDAALRCEGGQVRLGIGPDLDTARGAIGS